jgi:hypothetical protein
MQLIVRAAIDAQVMSCRVASPRERLPVIELQERPRAATLAVTRHETTALLVTLIDLAAVCRSDIATRSALSRSTISPARRV